MLPNGRHAFATLLLLAVFTIAARAATLYVNCGGVASVDTAPCPVGSPCRTIAFAVAQAAAGDTVSVSGACVEHDVNVLTAITIAGPSADEPATMDCTGGRCFILNFPGAVTLRAMSLSKGGASNTDQGGGVFCIDSTACTLVNVVISSCAAAGGGGAIAVTGSATLSLDGVKFYGNSGGNPAGDGGTVYAAGAMTAIRSTWKGYYACGENGGGAIYSSNSLTIDNCVFDGDLAANPSRPSAFNGGAIFARSAYLSVNNSVFTGHSACQGAALFLQVANAVLNNITAVNNYASVNGGGGLFYNAQAGSNLSIKNSLFANNSAAYEGGAAVLYGPGVIAYATITDTSFANNRAAELGGAIYDFGVILRMSGNVAFTGNEALGGAGFVLKSTSGSILQPLLIDSATAGLVVADNRACYGAGAYLVRANVTLPINTVFRNNSAAISDLSLGGGLLLEQSNVIMTGVTFDSNIAPQGAAIAGVTSSRLALGGVSFVSNSATNASVIAAGGPFSVALSTPMTICGNQGRSLAGNVISVKFNSKGHLNMTIDSVQATSITECPGCPTPCGGAGVGTCGYSGGAAVGVGVCTCVGLSMLDPATQSCYSITPGMPAPPVLITASNSINVTWTAPVSHYPVTSYIVERATGRGSSQFTTITQPSVTATWLVDTDVAAGTTYCYRVTATNDHGNSDPSNPTCGASTAPSGDSSGAGAIVSGATTGAADSSSGSNTGAIVGGVIGGLVALALIVGLIALVINRRKHGSSGKKTVSGTGSASFSRSNFSEEESGSAFSGSNDASSFASASASATASASASGSLSGSEEVSAASEASGSAAESASAAGSASAADSASGAEVSASASAEAASNEAASE